MQKEGLGGEFVSFTFVTGGNGGDGGVILGWLIIKSIFMSCRIDTVFLFGLGRKSERKIDSIPMVYSVSNLRASKIPVFWGTLGDRGLSRFWPKE